jgi:hypothetical protein
MYASPRISATPQIGPTIAPASFALELPDPVMGVSVLVVVGLTEVDSRLELVVDEEELLVRSVKVAVGSAAETAVVSTTNYGFKLLLPPTDDVLNPAKLVLPHPKPRIPSI